MEGSSSLTSFIKVASSVSTRVLPPGGHFESGAYYKNAVFMREICCVAEKNVCECVCVAPSHLSLYPSLGYRWIILKQTMYPLNSVVLLSWVFEVGSQNIWSDFFKRCTYFKNYCLHFQHTISASGRKLMRVLRQGRSHWSPVFQWAVSGGYGNGEGTLWFQELRIYLPTSCEIEQRNFLTIRQCFSSFLLFIEIL